MTFDIKNIWKIRRDQFYYALCLEHGYQYIENAGFFIDSSTIDDFTTDSKPTLSIADSCSLLSTPFGNLTKEVARSNDVCVMLTTGGFAPVHAGHLDMMKQAKRMLEYKGWKVINGYFSPDHDEYIKMKCDHEAVDISSRIAALNAAIKDDGNDWMFVDPWAGMFNKCAVNFTDVIQHLRRYLRTHLRRDIPIFFVCGADNARFANTFKNEGHCVVVGRPKYSERFWSYSDQYFDHDRIFFTSGNNDMSSTEVRKTLPRDKPQTKSLTLIVNSTLDQHIAWANEAKRVLNPYFKNVNLVHKEKKQLGPNVINLDKNADGIYNLNFSRCYDLFGTASFGYAARPGYIDLEQQVNNIPPGDYVLYDSDAATGGTMRFATELLAKNGIHITGTETLIDNSEEILDVEDFLLFSGDGLLIRLPNGTKTRAPYMLPYVDCRERCSVLDPFELSIDMWKLNRSYFQVFGGYLCDYPQYLGLFTMVGFNLMSHMSDICNWHIETLERAWGK